MTQPSNTDNKIKHLSFEDTLQEYNNSNVLLEIVTLKVALCKVDETTLGFKMAAFTNPMLETYSPEFTSKLDTVCYNIGNNVLLPYIYKEWPSAISKLSAQAQILLREHSVHSVQTEEKKAVERKEGETGV